MLRRLTLPAALLFSILLLTGLTSVSFATQTPSDRVEGCGRSGPRIDRGQTGALVGESFLTVRVPDAGTYFSLPARPDAGSGPALFICHVESGSSIIIDVQTAGEVSRIVGDPSGGAILDQIAANASAAPNPNVAPMTPPRTGDGGLKNALAGPGW